MAVEMHFELPTRWPDAGRAVSGAEPSRGFRWSRPRRSSHGSGMRNRITWEPWLSLGIGAGLTAFYQYVPIIAAIVGCLATVIHELGHTATEWFFGSIAIPAFDLKYGGGVTRSLGPQPVLIAALYGSFAFLTFQARRDWKKVALWLIFSGM
jgi:hypothetical protein